MARLRFGAFLAPHHPIGEHPMLQFRRDIALVEQLDKLGFAPFGTITSGFAVPAPGAAALAGCAGLLSRRRRRF